MTAKRPKNRVLQALRGERTLTRPVLENILVGTLTGALVGVLLKGYLGKLENLNIEWTLFLLIGLLIGLFSGFARAKKEKLEIYGEKLTEKIRESEKKLVKTEERYKSLFERANDVIFALDTESRFIEMNSKFEEILGYKREEWKGRSFYDLISSNCRDEAFKFYWETLKGGTPRFELEAIRADGQVVSLALANSPVRDSEGEIIGVMGIARDISESKKIEELQNKFISHVSHELRTPLAAMKEFVSLLIDGIPGRLNNKQKEYLNRIHSNIDRLTPIIENLLLVSQVDEEKITLERKLINVKELILQVRDDFKGAAEKNSLQFEISVADQLPNIYADPDKVIQVLTNLVGNALKFTPEGGWIRIGAGDSIDEVKIWVQDNGIGIAPQDQEMIFDRFQQIRSDHPFGRHGSGLGLAISREIIRLHRGRIWVESRRGQGSKFIFCLPKTMAPNILLVDDDPDLLEMFKDFLEPHHYRVSTAYNGEEAVTKAIREIPDLIILDIIMPRMNGYEVIGRLKENKETCNIPIIILTGYGLDQERLDRLGTRALPAMYKPVTMNEFLKTVSLTLEKSLKTSVVRRRS